MTDRGQRPPFVVLIAALLYLSISLSVAGETRTFVGGPSISSSTAGRYSLIARMNDNRFYTLDRSQGQRYRYGGASWSTQGWNAIPGASDFNSDPDSAVGVFGQFVVGRRSIDGGCWIASRGLPTGWGPTTAFPPWSAWMSCGGSFDSGLSIAVENDPAVGEQAARSVIHVFGRRADGGIHHRMATQTASGLSGVTDWALIPGGTNDSTNPVSPTMGFSSAPDAAVYDTPSGRKVAVCAQRLLYGTTGVLYCNAYDVGRGAWSDWIAMAWTKTFTGPGLTAGVDGNSYDVFHDLKTPNDGASSIGFRQWINDWWKWDLPKLPAISSISDPDAVTWIDPARDSAPFRLVCALNRTGVIQCVGSNSTAWGPWYAPDYVEITPAASAVTASTEDGGHVPWHAVDGDLATRWSGYGDGAWLQLDLGTTRKVGRVTFASYLGGTVRYRFDLEVATEPDKWTKVLENMRTSGTTTAEEAFNFSDVDARWVRYVGHGGSVGTSNSLSNGVTELSVWGR